MKRVPLKSRIALKGDIPLHWRSLYRTRNFFECALKDRCSLVDEVAIADAELIFSDAQPFSRTAPEDPPRVVAIHGGAVIDYKRLNVFLEGIRECDCLLVNCTSDVNLLRSFLRGSSPDIVLLPLPSWRATYNSLSVKEICFIPSSRKLIVFVARLVPMKNVHSFIQVVAHLSRSHDIHAIIVGDYWDDYPVLRSSQSYRSYIGRLTTSRVLEDRITRLDGSIPDDLLQAIVSQADLLIHPTVSIDENFGYVPLDALTSGTPVVGTHYGGLKDTFQCLPDMSATTWATPSGIRVDYHSLANMANRVLRNPETFRLRHRNLAMQIKERYSFEYCGSILWQAIRTAIARFRGGMRSRAQVNVPNHPSSGKITWMTERDRWDDYYGAAEYYSSFRKAPDLVYFTKIQTFSPWVFRDGITYFHDPIWPFCIKLTAGEMQVLGALGTNVVNVNRLPRESRELISGLLQSGIITGKLHSKHTRDV